MRQSKLEVYLHLVWATDDREHLITPDIEKKLYHYIETEAHRLKCKVLAIGGMPDHVHLAIKFPATTTISDLMQQIKGVSSHAIKPHLSKNQGFKWQSGYGAFSVAHDQRKAVIEYVTNQKEHHANNTIHPEWEETYEEI